LIVDDSVAMVETLKQYLGDHGFEVETATTGEAAVRQFQAANCDIVLTDLRMPGFDGLDVLEEIRKRDLQVPVVIMTAFGNVESAVEAIHRGAYHYVTKPFKMAALRVLLQGAARERLGREESVHLRSDFEQRSFALGLVGESPAVRELRTLIERVANAPSPVLILGETGSGKETVARAIHLQSERRGAPFVAVNCAVPPEMLLGDDGLFGNTTGAALAGAAQAPGGLLAQADGGTLFLDEVGDVPLALQAGLLQVIEGSAPRPGSNETAARVKLRTIAATTRDLYGMVQEGRFREDLYFRLNVVPIRLPPLRERPEDIAPLVDFFLGRRGAPLRGGAALTLTADALRLLESHSWPGNVRELENLIERLAVIAPRAAIDADAVRPELSPVFPGDPIQSLVRARIPLDVLERRYIAAVLRDTQGNKPKAAAILNIDLSTLYRREKQQQ
jgi:two-component system response regulator HydG